MMATPVTPRDDLLHALRLERGVAGRARSRAASLTLVAIAVAVAIAGFAWSRLRTASPQSVRVAPATPAVAAASPLDASGYVVARRQATVSAKVTGRLVAVPVEEGRHVAAGELIARLEDSNARADLLLASARYEAALATLDATRLTVENAKPTFERSNEQFRRSMISAQERDLAKGRFDDLRSAAQVAERDAHVAAAAVDVAKQNLEDTLVRAPFAGVITVKAAQEGEIVSPASGAGGFTRTGIGTIVDMDSLEVEVDVSESYIQRVRPEQRTVVTLGAYPRWRIPAHVIAVIPSADRAKATVRVRVALEERDERVLPNMSARVSFQESP